MNGFKNRAASLSGLIVVCAMSALAQFQSAPLASAPSRQLAAPINRPTQSNQAPDDFAGLTYSPDQQTKIDQIHHDTRAKMDVVVKDGKLNEDQKGAFFEGLIRMERNQVYMILTPEQRSVVQNRIIARHAAEKQEARKKTAEKEEYQRRMGEPAAK